MQNFSYGDSAQYKSAVNTWTSWLLCDLVAGQLRAGGARPRLARTRLDPANKRADQGLRLSGVHDRLHGGILSSSINRHDDADHPLTHAPIRECGFRDADGCLVLNLVESGKWRASMLVHLLTLLSRQLHHMSSLTPSIVPCNETFN
jgi:hypothetical protein